MTVSYNKASRKIEGFQLNAGYKGSLGRVLSGQ